MQEDVYLPRSNYTFTHIFRNSESTFPNLKALMKLNGRTIVRKVMLNLILESLNDFLSAYEEVNLKQYADAKYENFMLFRHPMKQDAKE